MEVAGEHYQVRNCCLCLYVVASISVLSPLHVTAMEGRGVSRQHQRQHYFVH